MNFFAALTCIIFAWGLAEVHKVFFEKFSERKRHLPQNTQNSQNLPLDILPQIADADVGGYGIPAAPSYISIHGICGRTSPKQNKSTSIRENIIEKTNNLSEIIRNFAASIVES